MFKYSRLRTPLDLPQDMMCKEQQFICKINVTRIKKIGEKAMRGGNSGVDSKRGLVICI